MTAPATPSLLEHYYHRLGAVNSEQIDFVTTMEELAGIRELLEKRYPPRVLAAHAKLSEPPSVSIITQIEPHAYRHTHSPD